MLKILFLLLSFNLISCAEPPSLTITNPVKTDWQYFQKILDLGIDKKSYTGSLGDFSHNGFNYEKLINDASGKLLISQQQENLKSSALPVNKNEQLAFWINAYNFFTIVDIVENYPVKSMKDIGWKKAKHLVFGKKYSLDDIEHKIIRPLKEPRIHFAINCASVSCPSLYEKVFTAENLEETLKSLTENAFRNPLHIELRKDKLYITKLLDWFEEDFEVQPFGSPENFIKVHAPTFGGKKISSYLDYNWDLNSPTNLQKVFKELNIKEK